MSLHFLLNDFRYVAMSLPKELGVMCPADSIIGLIKQSDSTASVRGYYLDVSAWNPMAL